ncbi:MAG TPA: sulfatase-like hydrolase/transferase [Chitinophagales bacterium]|nr:sulfatase-like hydrolase/transferase [Chitinophagales bacterium]HNI53081.1 sulfatase-like hydrolase/transferase [Chitinophagales bacterium]HNK96827.1 sulfatase-like hydrolase/transferase [Chitinophagales bacterium]HNO28494.1 sulfatase-like hydrolase/transferase [Chitinophagales bacterium]
MKEQLFHIEILLKRLGILLLLYMVCRILFFLFNMALFPHIPPGEFLQLMLYGLRFDLSSIIYVNCIFIVLHVVPSPWFDKNWYQRMLKIIFYSFNGVGLLLESGDWIYYEYGLKRTSTHELGLTGDTNILPQVIKDYWIIFVIAFILILGVEYLYRKTELHRLKKVHFKLPRFIHYPYQIIIMVVVLTFSVIGARGGIQPEPISPEIATDYVDDGRLTSLIINTPFSVIYAFGHRQLVEPVYYEDEQELAKQFNIFHDNALYYQWPDSIAKPSKPENVCVIVLESFSKEYIGYFNHGHGYTPFLDSLLTVGMAFDNAYSNGKSSNQGIVAVTSGIPVLMEEPFISSIYRNNKFEGVGTLLKDVGYSSYFFHGANNGSMQFDRFMAQAGFDGYFGRNEYGNDADFDGNWGIFDEPFLKWTANKMTTLKAPFYSEIFTISSHHPFTVPAQHVGQFPKGPIPMLEVVGYADYALQQFFEEAKKQPWYNNTLFIITADHPGPPLPEHEFYQEQVGAHSTWLLMYKPNGQFKGVNSEVVQQSDIMPTVLDYVGYKGKYMAFGNSIFDTTAARYAYNYHTSDYMLLDKDFALIFNGDRPVGLYDYKIDSTLSNNQMHEFPDITASMEDRIKAIIQIHHHAMINNKLVAE